MDTDTDVSPAADTARKSAGSGERQTAERRRKPAPERDTEPERRRKPAPERDTESERRRKPAPERAPEPERRRKPAPEPEDEYEPEEAAVKRHRPVRTLGQVLAFVGVTIVMLVAGVYFALLIMMKGPSPTARNLLTMSLRETSAIGFIANIYLSDDQIAEIEANSGSSDIAGNATDSSLITIVGSKDETGASEQGTSGGIEVIDVSGSTFRGKLMIVTDPTRIFVGTPEYYGGSGLTLTEMVDKFGAVAGVNGGGFYDPNGTGNGGTPEGIVISDGVLRSDGGGGRYSTAVIDGDGILHVGSMTASEAVAMGAQQAVSFGPVLVVNGEKCDGLDSGLNPRTAIGQRSDGAILLLVIDGRQVESLGATYGDAADLMIEYGALNAMNLDGGSSSSMFYEGEIINICASVIGARPLPSAVLVR